MSPPGSEAAVALEAIARRDLDALEDLFDRWWYALPARFGAELLDLLADVPGAVSGDRPRLLVAGLLAHQFASEPHHRAPRGLLQGYPDHGARLGERLDSFTRPSDVVAAGILAMTSARRRGSFAESERIGAWTEERTLRVEAFATLPWSGNRVAARPGLVALQRGITAMLAGDTARAIGHLRRAHMQAGPPPFQHFAGAAACADVAMLCAVRGHHRLARRWLDGMRACGPVPDVLRHHLLQAADIAEAVLAIDALERTAATAALDRAGEGSDETELWPFLSAAHAAFSVTFDGAVDGLLQLDADCFAHGMAARPGPTSHPQLLRAHADLLAALGESNQVLELARRTQHVLAPPAARMHLLAGQPHDAVKVAGRALAHPAVSPRDAIDLQLTIAVAHLRTERPDLAGHAFSRALVLREQGLLQPFGQLPAADVLQLCHLTGTDPASLAPALDLAGQDEVRIPLPLITLTGAERRVLAALAAGANTTRIAQEQGVSVNTVRTHVKNLYRKLGATSRAAALARASHLGMLPR